MDTTMHGAELASMLKSSAQFKSHDGIVCPELNLAPEDKKWWQDAKIGMFFHWGLYSALGKGEWAMFNEGIPYEAYRKQMNSFDPQDFDMHSLTGLAKDFGAKYMVMVTRHHDGFSMWDSKSSYERYTSMRAAAKRDFVREYVTACHDDGLRIGLYYSPMDWRFKGYFDPTGAPESAAAMKAQCYAQVEELTENYGPIDILWYDGGWLSHQGTDADAAWFWEPAKLNKMVRSRQPKILINPRSGWQGDFECDEGPHEITGDIIPFPWEKNMSVSVSWSWLPEDQIIPTDDLIKMIVDVVCRDGNLLLNVGPDRNGKVHPEAVKTIRAVGMWLKQYGESIYETRGGMFQPLDRIYGSTCKGNEIFLHILDIENFRGQTLPYIPAGIIACRTWDGVSCAFTQNEDGLRIQLPEGLPKQRDTILRLQCDRPVFGLLSS